VHLILLSEPAGGAAPFARALALARRWAATLDIVGITEGAEPPTGPEQDAALRRLEAATAPLLRPGDVRPRLSLVAGGPAAVKAQAEMLHPELVVTAPHVARRLPPLPCPILAVAEDGADPWQAVVVGVDFAAGTDRAIAWAARLAGGATLHLAHAYRAPFGTPPAAVAEELAYGQRLELDSVVDALRDRQQAGALPQTGPVAGHVREGEPAAVLTACVSKTGAGLLVVGHHRRSRLAELIFGHTSALLLDRPPCDVLLVPDIDGGGPTAKE
jgi:nucleotide-binding universal stress UspA family protein